MIFCSATEMGGGGLDSWDSTIRMWDVRTGECVRVITDHHADVYGIAAHPNRCVPPPARARHGHRALNNISKVCQYVKWKYMCVLYDVLYVLYNVLYVLYDVLYVLLLHLRAFLCQLRQGCTEHPRYTII